MTQIGKRFTESNKIKGKRIRGKKNVQIKNTETNKTK